MAGNLFDISLDSLFRVHPNYAGLPDVVPLLGFGPPEADWDVQNFGLIRIWSNAAIDDKALQLTVGETWCANITQGIISTRTAIRGLRLAMSIPSMNPNNTKPLLTQQARDIANAVNIPNTDDFPDSPFTLMPTSSRQHHVVILNAPAGHDADAQRRRSSYCFLAAYMMKLIVKSPANVVAGLRDMKRKYESFYGRSQTVSRFNVTLEQATAYKTALLNQELVSQTYTHAIAHTHQNCVGDDMDPQEVEVLSYLVFQPFSYTGMHVYSLIMELKDFTKLPLDEIVSLFMCGMNARALKKVSQIAERYERTTLHPDRDVTFRYCTLWGPQYFASIRSRKCAALVFTVAHAWKSLGLGAQHGNNSDPTRIAALNSLSDSLKKTLQQTGERAADLLKQKMN